MVLHGSRDLEETSNVGTLHERRKTVDLLGRVSGSSLNTSVEAANHDVLELLVNLLLGPGDSLRVLSHLKTGDSNTTGVGSLTGTVPDTVGSRHSLGLKDLNGVRLATHVGTLGDELAAGSDERLGLLAGNLVLGSTGESNVDLANVAPGSGILNVLELGLGKTGRGVEGGQLLVLQLDVGDLLNLSGGETLSEVGDKNKSTLGVRHGDNVSTELNNLESGVLGNVSGTRDGNSLALEGLLARGGVLNHLLDVVDKTETSGLGSDQGSTPGETLTGQDTLPSVLVLLVGTEEETNLSATNTDITSGDISISTNVSVELAHEGVAESSDLGVRLALGVKVGTTLTTTDVETSEGVLEDLLVSEELENGEVHGRVESETTLVRAQSRVELDSVATVDLQLALIILPDNSELDDSLRDGDDRDDLLVLGVLLKQSGVVDRVVKLVVGLLEFGFLGVVHDVVYWMIDQRESAPLYIPLGGCSMPAEFSVGSHEDEIFMQAKKPYKLIPGNYGALHLPLLS